MVSNAVEDTFPDADVQQNNERKSAYRIIKNIRSYKYNEPHIFRYHALHNVYSAIAAFILDSQLKLQLETGICRSGIVMHYDSIEGNQAEIIGTEKMSVGKRLKIHIKLLRMLKKGKSIKRAVHSCRLLF